MAGIKDVAEYILSKVGRTSTWKLQKLVYYSQAWHLIWEDEPLFGSRIEAWANGPVCVELYEMHRGQFSIGHVRGGEIHKLNKGEKSSIDAVVKFYGKFNGQQLSDRTHQEPPWKNARRGLAPDERGNHEITLEALSEYYSSLIKDGKI